MEVGEGVYMRVVQREQKAPQTYARLMVVVDDALLQNVRRVHRDPQATARSIPSSLHQSVVAYHHLHHHIYQPKI
jgi:hypothetical protein